MTPVHPRVCGELPHHPRGRHVVHRFIPACAGNSPFLPASARRRTGSSPRVRGTPRTQRQLFGQLSVHPRVCGELAATRCNPKRVPSVHPRVCGELVDLSALYQPVRGSSPRVRGTRRPPRRSRRAPPVHPRVCGELTRAPRGSCGRGGSSPRVRGTRRVYTLGSASAPVHPRVCGELMPRTPRAKSSSGSSPRVRGTQHRLARQRHAHRFIPACAGNSWLERPAERRKTVHPRVCGELTFHKCLK